MTNATFADLFSTDLLLHYDASDSASLFTDTGGTSAASNGNEVKCWKPASDATLSVNLTESTGPTYRSNYASSGYAALEFDGTNDRLGNSFTGITGSRMFVLACVTLIGSSGTIWWRGANTSHFLRNYVSAANTPAIQSAGGAGAFFSALPSTVTGRMVLASVYGDSQNQLDALGTCFGNKNTGTISGSITSGFYVGAGENSGSQFQPCNMALHEILVVGANCEWGQVIRGAKILRNKWGVADPNALPQTASGSTLIVIED